MNKSLSRRMFLQGTTAAFSAASISGLASSASAKEISRPTPLYGPPPGVAKLNANENPYGPSPAALKAMMEASQKGAYYVYDSVMRLKTMIAERHGLTPDHIALGSGSSAGLVAAAIVAGRKGSILGPDLFWDTTARVVEIQDIGEIKRLPKLESLAIDLDAMYAAIDDSISMVQVTNPNNPTGMLIDPVAMRNFCIKASKKCTVLADEAYNELTDNSDANTVIPLIKQGHDVIVARTFSKIYGLAGMRVGYLIAQPEKIAEMERFGIGWYGLNQAGLAAAIASYEDHTFMDYSRAKVKEAREMVSAAVKENGLTALPSVTNFMFVNLGDLNAETFREEMAKENVLIRGIYRDYTNWSRVSMGYIEDVQQYTSALPKVLHRMS
ncbi:pyridoxal phosphate-dependent aminotransferase [Microbulbifer hydrolyticus]|uniref:Aminotransferase class I/II-fold pyridoxal phosphate-dependent enzyme n=1 Tax=Microbulbifer hydrolyticus TaxID=48074 RepID=A0A6P1T8G1_9GAMM|nr:aminotransferase class I/II-fold pyridoxal phosphate-dependent enzyme [Microbulbifer hydrolyticus]MBB5211261.1 histidinol-phosphate aminotransferase [Microbulbifer hydrolyticus]QHQ37973.1 aminotransferase class I/II-fold pyridoxal phosphate-dependent enzyme [Microbulbifer hydrolyticus]